MRCPGCSVTDIPEGILECPLCGYRTENHQVAVLPADELDERIQAELSAQFQIDRELWRTEEFRCYQAHETSGRLVSLTVVPRPSPPDSVVDTRFQRAINAVAALDHPHLLPVFGSGITSTLYWCSTQYHEGRPLHEWLRQFGPLDIAACRRLVEQVASALDHAHRRGITHGDVATTNILIDAEGWAFITNFSFVQATRAVSQDAEPNKDVRDLGLVVAKCLNLPGDAASVPRPVLQAIERAAGPGPAALFPSVLDFVAALSNAVPATAAPIPVPSRPSKPRSEPFVLIPDAPESPPARKRWMLVAMGIVALVAVATGSLVFMGRPAQVAQAPQVTEPQDSAPSIAVPIEPQPPANSADSLRVQPTAPVRAQPVEPVQVQPTRTAAAPPARPPQPRPVARPVPEPQPVTGQLFVNSTPWAQVYVDGELLGNTPKMGVSIRGGAHTVRVVRDGFQPFERQVVVAAGTQIRLTDLVLTPK